MIYGLAKGSEANKVNKSLPETSKTMSHNKPSLRCLITVTTSQHALLTPAWAAAPCSGLQGQLPESSRPHTPFQPCHNTLGCDTTVPILLECELDKVRPQILPICTPAFGPVSIKQGALIMYAMRKTETQGHWRLWEMNLMLQ